MPWGLTASWADRGYHAFKGPNRSRAGRIRLGTGQLQRSLLVTPNSVSHFRQIGMPVVDRGDARDRSRHVIQEPFGHMYRGSKLRVHRAEGSS